MSAQPVEIQHMLAHHAAMSAELQARVEVLRDAAASPSGSWQDARQHVSDYLTHDVVPHALAEEESVYDAGGRVATLAPLVVGMTMEHEVLVGLAARLAQAPDGVSAASVATAFFELFEIHVSKENELLLPGLLEAGVDPAVLLHDMGSAFGKHQAQTRDQAKAKDQAKASSGAAPAEGVASRDGEPVVDTRAHAAGGCAQLATVAVDGLTEGSSFVLVADHDPRGIRYMLDAERPGLTSWDPLEEGPDRWQVRIARTAERLTRA